MASTRDDTYSSVYTWYVWCTSNIKDIEHTRFNWELSVELHFRFKYLGILQPQNGEECVFC